MRAIMYPFERISATSYFFSSAYIPSVEQFLSKLVDDTARAYELPIQLVTKEKNSVLYCKFHCISDPSRHPIYFKYKDRHGSHIEGIYLILITEASRTFNIHNAYTLLKHGHITNVLRFAKCLEKGTLL